MISGRRTCIGVLVCTLMLAGCVGQQNRPMQLISGSGPVYPAGAKAAGIEGEVVVRYDITVDGEVDNARVERSEPSGVFDQAALAAVRSWHYNPQLVEGEPQAVQNVLSTVRFTLADEDAPRRY